MSEVHKSMSKENLDPNESPTKPNRQSLSPELSSPVQSLKNGSNAMWDSNNPMRNPPPLPLSPQIMLRNTGNRTNNSNPGSPGKLQFANIDNSEVEYQLKKITETQTALKSLMSGVDTSVKQTQLDLENLLERSSNNNSHLKNLLQNVVQSSSSANDSSLEKLKEDFESCFTKLNEKLDSNTSDKSLIEDKFKELEELFKSSQEASLESLTNLKKSITESQSSSEKEEYLKKYQDLFNSYSKDTQELFDSKSKDIYNVLKTVEEQLQDATSHRGILVDNNQNILDKISSIDFDPKFSSIEKSIDKLSSKQSSHSEDLTQINKSIENNKNDTIQELSKAIDFSKIESTLESLQKSQKKNDESFVTFQEKVLDISSKSESNEQLTEKIESILNDKFESVTSHFSNYSNEQLIKNHKLELEKKDLELQLKDKEIEELKQKLATLETTQSLSTNITELCESKAKLEAKNELLNETYENRYKQFKQLHDEFDKFNSKLSHVQMDKLSSIMGNATLVNITNKTSEITTPNTAKQNISNRILSTNSYLTNAPNFGTPKGIKKYELKPIESFEEKENIEA